MHIAIYGYAMCIVFPMNCATAINTVIYVNHAFAALVKSFSRSLTFQFHFKCNAGYAPAMGGQLSDPSPSLRLDPSLYFKTAVQWNLPPFGLYRNWCQYHLKSRIDDTV